MAASTGECFCGKVKVVAVGEPFSMGYCHCDSCRHWSAGPINVRLFSASCRACTGCHSAVSSQAFTLWKPDQVSVTAGVDDLATFAKNPRTERKFCRNCGGHVMSVHPDGGFVDVFAAILKSVEFKPSIHVFYGEKVVSVHDGLPKFRDVPAEMGGSGETVPE